MAASRNCCKQEDFNQACATAQYIGYSLGLADDKVECLMNSPQEVMLTLEEFFFQQNTEHRIKNLWDAEEPFTDIMRDVIQELCDPDITTEDLFLAIAERVGGELLLQAGIPPEAIVNACPYIQHCFDPTIDLECALQEINWYYMPVEGLDWYYDEEYWLDPNLAFSQQVRPTYSAFRLSYNATLDKDANELYEELGGELLDTREDDIADGNFRTENTCALRVAIALNETGVIIPDIPETLGDENGKYYFLNAKALTNWLKLTFGSIPNSKYIRKSSPEDDPINSDSFGDESNRGIFTMIAKDPSKFGASGHADKYNGANCSTGCHFTQGKEYNLWILD